jgi:hypothetical protein
MTEQKMKWFEFVDEIVNKNGDDGDVREGDMDKVSK